MKALCVLEAILRKKEEGNFSIVHTYFSENTDVIQRCADSPQSSLREKANKVRCVHSQSSRFWYYVHLMV